MALVGMYIVYSGHFYLVLSLQWWCVCLLFISFAINCLFIELLSFNSYIFCNIYRDRSLLLKLCECWFDFNCFCLFYWFATSKLHTKLILSHRFCVCVCYKMNCFYFLSIRVAKRECTSENYVVWLIRQVSTPCRM